MKSRIYDKFEQLKKDNKKAFITFITGGDPDVDTTYELVLAMEKSGADIVEIGIPYSDPLADGPVIQQASLRALNGGTKIDDIFGVVSKLRKVTQIPLVFLVYYNSIFRYGQEKFIGLCHECGVDGLIIPDIPIEERKELVSSLKDKKINLIPLVALTSEDRIRSIVDGAEGFVYCVSCLGVTGGKTGNKAEIEELMKQVSKYTDLPKCIGFGISTREDVMALKNYSEGLIVGSAIVRKVAEGIQNGKSVENVSNYVSEMRKAF